MGHTSEMSRNISINLYWRPCGIAIYGKLYLYCANHPAVVLTNNYQSYTASLLFVCCSNLPWSIFLELFVLNDSAFALLSTPVTQTDGLADEQM